MYIFIDKNVNTIEVPLYDSFKYIKNSDAYNYKYLIKKDIECVNELKICD